MIDADRSPKREGEVSYVLPALAKEKHCMEVLNLVLRYVPNLYKKKKNSPLR